jgi:murein DD-endopeptidase MepM/ murein hydrolase activator NlpD
MKVIILDPKRGISRTIPLPAHWHAWLAAFLLLLPALGAWGGYALYANRAGDPVLSGDVGRDTAAAWRDRIASQRDAIAAARLRAEEKMKAMTVRVAEMQAKLLRLDALGERLARTTSGGKQDFDFSRPPPVGGPEEAAAGTPAFHEPDFVVALDDLANRIEARETELKVFESLLTGNRLQAESFLSGNPVNVGYLSSSFGYRIDPFHGSVAFHRGVDFAGPAGSAIVATGDGLVTFAGEHAGYGNMVEIAHGDGISTVYAHASRVLVRAGDIVRKDQPVAKLGSTGRSTGPHVHYEVRRAGVAMDPAAFVSVARVEQPVASAVH